MTPKEKARELINFMYDVDIKEDSEFKPLMKWSYAKKCALIAVDEIWNYVAVIEQHETADFAFGGSFDGDEYFKYLQQVKQEIEKL